MRITGRVLRAAIYMMAILWAVGIFCHDQISVPEISNNDIIVEIALYFLYMQSFGDINQTVKPQIHLKFDDKQDI